MGVTVRRRGNAKAHVEKIRRALAGGPKMVKVGFPASEAESDILDRAVFNEFGTRSIPERPFMRNAIKANRASYRTLAGGEAVAIVRGQRDTHTALSRIGVKAQGDIQKEVVSLDTPPNAPSTIVQKGSSNPLIDTGEMRQRVTFKVED